MLLRTAAFLLLALGLVCLSGVGSALAFSGPAPTQFLVRGDGRVAYDDSGGPGPLLIAIPGMGESRHQYRLLRPRLVAAGFRVVTMDVRGQGASSARWSDYSARAVGGDALALIGHLGRSQAFLLGNSFAAGAALWAAHEQPGAVLGIGMLGPILRDPPTGLFTRLVLDLGLAGPWRTWFWMSYWDGLFPLRRPADHADYRRQLVSMLREPGRMDALRTMIGLSKAATEALVGQVDVPVLVVMGDRDPDFPDPVAEAAWISRTAPARVMLVPGAGHYPHVEAPDPVAAEILHFFQWQLRLAGRPGTEPPAGTANPPI